MLQLLIILSLFTVTIHCGGGDEMEKCITLDKTEGSCSVLEKCPCTWLPIFNKSNVEDVKTVKLLLRSSCRILLSTSRDEVPVCCPLKTSSCQTGMKSTPDAPKVPQSTYISNTTMSSTTPTQTTSDTFDSILNHKNLHLLPSPSSMRCGRKVQEVFKTKIAGGSNAGLGTYPWMALIGYTSVEPTHSWRMKRIARRDKELMFLCAGSLINSRYVLTAAHCVKNVQGGYVPKLVRLGEYNRSSEIDCDEKEKVCAPHYEDVPIEKIISHEDYDITQTKENDIALIRLQRDVTYHRFLSPVCLPIMDTSKSGSWLGAARVTGWGKTSGDDPEMAAVLQVVDVPLRSNEICSKFYSKYFGKDVSDDRVCAGGVEGQDSCQGDSGGPLLQDFLSNDLRVVQIGIVSVGAAQCDSTVIPGIYTSVKHFLPWVLDNISV